MAHLLPLQLSFEGPKGKVTYKGRGTFAVKLLASQVCGALTASKRIAC